MNIKTLKTDIPAGLVLFLVALPLCLGIALASGAPLMSGIISGIIGGVIIGFMSGSQTSVSGPAAGLATVVLASIQQLGSFETFLFAVILAGLMQLTLGFAKMGYIVDFFPSNIIKGLLAAIGIILILKQIPYAIGYDANLEGDFNFINPTGEITFTRLFHAIDYITPGAIIISIVSLIILLYWQKTPLKNITFLRPSLVVAVTGIVLSGLLYDLAPALIIGQKHMVNIPAIDFSSIGSFYYLPDFSLIARSDIWTVAVTLAVVASLETLLNLEAVDKIDPHKRHSPPNRELIAQGVGNVLAGLFGGIPVTSVIVRSSVNIQTENKTKLSAIFHGVLLLLSVLLFAPIMNMIPLASLAAILLVTGYKLANISLFRSMYVKGIEQFIPFIATVLGIVFTDLLIGLFVGFSISISFLMISRFRKPNLKQNLALRVGEVLRLDLPNQVTFLNKASIKKILHGIPEDKQILIDATSSEYIDPDIIEIIEDFKSTIAVERRIRVNFLGQQFR